VFHILPQFFGHANNTDWVHGREIGSGDYSNSTTTITIWYPDCVAQPTTTDQAMATLFVAFGVQYGFHLLWHGRLDDVVQTLRTAVPRSSPPRGGGVWFEEDLGLVLDLADAQSYEAWRAGTAPLVYYPFKQALFVLRAREMARLAERGVASEALIARVEQRALGGQASDGSFCNQVRVGQDGKALLCPSLTTARERQRRC
jgi:hypothetical protein